jgi:hypothetical protein
MPTINGWADAVDAPDGDFQGSAAGAFRYVLRGFATELGVLHTELNTPGPYWTPLTTARTTLGATHLALWGGYSTWRSNARAMPINCVIDSFMDAMRTADVNIDSSKVSYTSTDLPTVTIRTPLGDPTQQDFWDRVQSRAKQYWLLEVSTALDAAATPAMDTLNTVYEQAASALPDVQQTKLPAPPAPETGTDDNPGKGDGPSKQDGPDTGDGPGTGPSTGPDADTGGKGSATPTLTSGATSGGPGTGKKLTSAPGTPVLHPGSTTSSTDVPMLTKDGKQLTDPETGQPIMVPPGTTVGKNGELFGPDGRPVLGADGKPIYAPKGSKPARSQDLANVSTGHVVDATVPEGSTIGADGVVRGPGGKTVLDANGNPVHVPKGTTIGKDGTIIGPDGKPVPEQTQLLDNEEHAMLHPELLPRPKTASAVGGDLSGFPAISAGGASPGGTAVGLSPRAAQNGGRLTPEQLAAQEAAAGESAAEQAQLLGRQTATSGGEPMMPPMGGMGGAGAGGGQDRQRTTWLAEDEEVWGTDSEAVSGVIGR